MDEGEGWSRTFLLEHESMDLVIMNPPFTRPTNHEATDVPVPSFAGLGNDAEEQTAMSDLLKEIRREVKNPAGHGNSGLASNFLDLAHAKVRPGGMLAMVMPLSLLQGASWQASRDLLRSNYARAIVIGLASPGRDDAKSFSADAGMGEVLVVARRRHEASTSVAIETPVTYVALRKRPTSALEAVGLVAAIRDVDVHDKTRVTLGGRAWPNFTLRDHRHETAVALWANTTLGLILFWWAGKVQQTGRACLTISQLPDLHVLDPRTLTKVQQVRAQELFDAFKARTLLPANEAYRDETRQALDRAVLVNLLGLPEAVLEPLAVLRTQWCCEPTVHGGKANRPDAQAGAGPVTGPAQPPRPLLRTV